MPALQNVELKVSVSTLVGKLLLLSKVPVKKKLVNIMGSLLGTDVPWLTKKKRVKGLVTFQLKDCVELKS